MHESNYKRLKETKLKRKPLSSPVSVKAVRWKGWGLWRERFRKRYLLSLEWKRVRVMYNDSGDDETDKFREFD